LRYDESPDDEQRFYMLLAIREFAYEQLTGAGEVALARNAHHAWYTELAEQAERELVGPGQDLWLKRLEAEQDNFRAALSWAIEQQDITATLRLGAALWRYWAVHGDLQEGRTWLEQGLALPGEVDPATLSK